MESGTGDSKTITFSSLERRVIRLSGGSKQRAYNWLWSPNKTLGGFEPALFFFMGQAEVIDRLLERYEKTP